MDLEEWEFLSDDGFIDQLQTQDGNSKRAISRENLAPLYPNSTIHMNYFQKFTDPKKQKKPPNLVIPVPVEFDLSIRELPKSDDSVVKEAISPETAPNKAVEGGEEGDKETVSSQVFFKKMMRENEFADMKLDSSPKSTNRGLLLPQIDVGKPTHQFEEGFDDADKKSPDDDDDDEVFECKDKLPDPDEKMENGGLNIWKMGMTGVGALCSFGFACATICVIVLGSRHRDKPQDQKLHFQIYTDDKRIKQVVHHAAKLNEAISAVRGAPLNRARITIGGYFEGL